MIVRALLRQLPLAFVTLLILSLIIFFAGQLLPGDVGRAVLGPLADARAVARFNQEAGVDRPVAVQYWEWIGRFARGDMGESYVFRAPVAPFVLAALANSLKLAAVAFCMIVPLGVLGGVAAALRAGGWRDRLIILTGQSLGVVPEFISSLVLILILGIWLRWLPMSADWPEGAGALTQAHHLVLPALPLVLLYFGYVARVARTGAVAALDADYTRTAILKGLPPRTVLVRHVLRNALLPTITVSASLVGYLVGGLVVVETLFRYRGIGSLIYTAAKAKDFPMLMAGVLAVGLLYTVAAIVADLLAVALDPRLRTREIG